MKPEEKPGHMDDIDRRVQEITKVVSQMADAAESVVGHLFGPITDSDAPHGVFPAVEGSVRRIHQSLDTLNAVMERLERHIAILTDL